MTTLIKDYSKGKKEGPPPLKGPASQGLKYTEKKNTKGKRRK
jgi:hypothetical protein|tara:strand:+ start:769 stop:894 length:126 start_codon:yes stop_codon:yes gene_type:complete